MLFTLPPIRTLILADLPVKLKGSADFFELKILFFGDFGSIFGKLVAAENTLKTTCYMLL